MATREDNMDIPIIYLMSTKEALSFKPRKGFGAIYKYDFPSLSGKYPSPSYIGQTTQPMSMRHTQHKSAKKQNVFNNTLVTHNFSLSIVCLCEKDDLNTMEIDWIDKCNSVYPSGLNYDFGGKRKEMTEETRKKLSQSLKQVFNAEKYRNERSKRTKSQWDNPIMREKMIKGMKAEKHPRSEEYMRTVRTPVLQMSLDGEIIATYPSITCASIETGIAREQIRDTVNGHQKTCKGYKFIKMDKEGCI